MRVKDKPADSKHFPHALSPEGTCDCGFTTKMNPKLPCVIEAFAQAFAEEEDRAVMKEVFGV